MLRAHRFSKIEDALARQPFLEVKALARQLHVSDATVRRDLEELHRTGRLQRTRGGAISSHGHATLSSKRRSQSPNGSVPSLTDAAGSPLDTLDHVTSFSQRAELRATSKARIGEAAAALIEDGQNVLLAGGTTCYAAAKHLRQRRVSVVTNSLPAAALLGETLGVDVLVTGGMVYPKHDILIGPHLKQTLDHVRAGDWLLIGAGGADAEGFYDSNHWEVEGQRELMVRANRVALLLDAAKFQRRDMVFVADWTKIDVLVTDATPPAEIEAALQQANVQIIVAQA